MSGTDQILYLMSGLCALMVPIGLYMGHQVDVHTRRIEAEEDRRILARQNRTAD